VHSFCSFKMDFVIQTRKILTHWSIAFIILILIVPVADVLTGKVSSIAKFTLNGETYRVGEAAPQVFVARAYWQSSDVSLDLNKVALVTATKVISLQQYQVLKMIPGQRLRQFLS